MAYCKLLNNFSIHKNVYNQQECVKSIVRPDCTYKMFVLGSQTYSQQYCQLYFCRYHQLVNRLAQTYETNCLHKFPLLKKIRDVGQSSKFLREYCTIIGILYKDMALKPSVLKEYTKDLDIETATKSYLSNSDLLYLEDDTVRILLINSITAVKPLPVDVLITGLVIAVTGCRTSTGHFEVIDWTLPGVLLPKPIVNTTATSKYIAFVSGSDDINKKIVRLIVIGSTMSNPLDQNNIDSIDKVSSVTPVKILNDADTYFAQLTASINIDLVPGENDPTNYLIPQQPIHPLMFPKSKYFKSFQSITNPYKFSIDDVNFIGSSGQPIKDIIAFSSIEKPIDALTLTIEAQCICPTAPDTLACYPFVENDPFVITEQDAPHVYFSGNHDTLDYKYWNAKKNVWSNEPNNTGPLALCIPKFTNDNLHSSSLILVEIDSLEVKVIKFE